MGSVETKSKIASNKLATRLRWIVPPAFLAWRRRVQIKKLATQLRRIVRPERGAEVVSRGPFKAAIRLVGEERLLDEVLWLLFFSVDAGVMAGLAESRGLDLVRPLFLKNLRTELGPTNFDTLTIRIFEYQKAIGNAPDDRCCVGRRFAEFCGLEGNPAIAVLVTVLFWSTAKQATELVEKYKLAI